MAEWVEREVHDVDECQIEQWQSAKCTKCGLYHTTPFLYFFKEYKYCPNCGEPMKGKEGDRERDN